MNIHTPPHVPPLPRRHLRLNSADNVIVAIDPIDAGREIEGVKATARIMRGHKMAMAKLERGAPVIKFGQIIGFAHADILPGDHIHTHNCDFAAFERDYHHAEDAKPEDILPLAQQATFEGFRRAKGRAGTRNYIGILT
jgi:altronate hydrolase